MNIPLTLLAQADSRTVFEWGRIQSPSDWILPLIVLAALLVFARLMYRRDSVELSGWVGWSLTLLRFVAIIGLWLVYLQPRLRSEREVVFNSQVLVVADTSLSMAAQDTGVSTESLSRAEEAARAMSDARLTETLRRRHDVFVWKFGETAEPLAQFERRSSISGQSRRNENGSDVSETGPPWSETLTPGGIETRLGSALMQVLEEHRTAPVSGVILLSDGGQNAGPGPSAAIKLAKELETPVHTIGIGSPDRPSNVLLRDLAVPSRAYPGDPYTVTGYIQATGFERRAMTVELWSRSAGIAESESSSEDRRLEATETVTLGAEDEVVPVEFEITPEAIGRRRLELLVKAPPDDANSTDNAQEAEVEIVDRKTRVLLFAGGPTREYRFVRIQLFRDRGVTLDVFLQTGAPGIAQEADSLLDHFPSTREELSAYDAVIAFDPDWLALASDQIDTLEQWVAEQAGGLILIAGPVYTDRWTQSASVEKLRALYPVEFNRRFTTIDSRYGAEEPWPIEFTREGLESDFLKLEDSPSRSAQAWAGFPGVYGYHALRGAKPGATVYGRFSDPRAGEGDELPVYLAGQFYGSGRVMYLGSGEMWRLRSLDPAYFERLYTQLIRHVSHGRLLRGSTRGLLLVERDRYRLGQTVSLRAQLTDAQLEPLEAPQIEIDVVAPGGELDSVQLLPDVNREGSFAGQFTARREGTYRFALTVPESDGERLERQIQVVVPQLERQNPERNDAMLARIAADTGGQFYRGVGEALGDGESTAVASILKDRSRVEVQVGKPQPLWDNIWVMAGICGLLSLEWLIRRIVRLA